MIKLVIVGFGAMGRKTTEELLLNENIELVSIVDKNPEFKNKYSSDYITCNKDVPIKKSIEEVNWESVDLAIVMSASFITQIEPLLIELANRKVNILTIAEEMSYPEVANEKISRKIDEIAKKNNITILGTGVNPGFVLDYLIITLSNVCLEIEEIEARRVNDLSEFGETVFRSQGIGLTKSQFQAGVKDGSVVGHVGFKQSIHLIGKALNWELIDFKEEKSPILAEKTVETKEFKFKKNIVVGCNHRAYATFTGNKKIILEHPQQICVDGYPETKDEIIFKGTPDLNLKIEPEIQGGIATVAMTINMIPLIIEAKSGLITLLELPKIPAMFNKNIIKKLHKEEV